MHIHPHRREYIIFIVFPKLLLQLQTITFWTDVEKMTFSAAQRWMSLQLTVTAADIKLLPDGHPLKKSISRLNGVI